MELIDPSPPSTPGQKPPAHWPQTSRAGQISGDEPLLRTDSLTRVVEGRRLVDEVSIAVGRGEVVAITGPSGSGKSSLLRLLNRLDEPTSGTVYLNRRDYREIAPRELRRRLGMLLQRPFLFPGTVAHNLVFGPTAHGKPLAPGAIAELLTRVGLSGYAERDVSRLSGGEAQRVALARTLAVEPEILLLDEPTSALDETSRRGVEQLICGIIEGQGLTCILVTHDEEQAARMAKRILRLELGAIRE